MTDQILYCMYLQYYHLQTTTSKLFIRQIRIARLGISIVFMKSSNDHRLYQPNQLSYSISHRNPSLIAMGLLYWAILIITVNQGYLFKFGLVVCLYLGLSLLWDLPLWKFLYSGKERASQSLFNILSDGIAHSQRDGQ